MNTTSIISALTEWFQVGNEKVSEVSTAFVVSLITIHRSTRAYSQHELGQVISLNDVSGKCTPVLLSRT